MATGQDLKQQSDRLYEEFGRPLEAEHRGEYAAIAPDGRSVVAPTLVQAIVDGRKAFGAGNFVFKIGERVAVTWR